LNKILLFGIIGGIFAISLSTFHILLGLSFAGVLKSLGFYTSAPHSPYAIRVNHSLIIGNLILGAIGLPTAIVGIIGSWLGKIKGGMMMIITSSLFVAVFGYVGILPFVFMFAGGLLAEVKEIYARKAPITHSNVA